MWLHYSNPNDPYGKVTHISRQSAPLADRKLDLGVMVWYPPMELLSSIYLQSCCGSTNGVALILLSAVMLWSHFGARLA